ncbi:MAG: DUF502 domain-containing protein [Hyphomicrobium sp.]
MTGPKTEPKSKPASTARDAELTAGLKRLARDDGASGWHLGARLRTAFLTGLVIVGPVTITLYIMWWLINWVDAWVKPLLPTYYNPDTYLPFPLPGLGLLVAIIGMTIIGALAANLLGRTLVLSGELMLSRMPIVRNVYTAIKQIFESVISSGGPKQSFQKVGLIEFPSKGLWSIVFVTGETTGEISDAKPGGQGDLLTVFMPTGIVPPTGFICFVPRKDVTLLSMTAEEAAKVILSGGIVMPDLQAKLKDMGALPAAALKPAGDKAALEKPTTANVTTEKTVTTKPVSGKSSRRAN